MLPLLRAGLTAALVLISSFSIRFCLRQAVVFISFCLVAMPSLRLHRHRPRHPCCQTICPAHPLYRKPHENPGTGQRTGEGGTYGTRTCLEGGGG